MDKVTLPTKAGLIEQTKYNEVCKELTLLKQNLSTLKIENETLLSQNIQLKNKVDEFSNFDQKIEEQTKIEVEKQTQEIRLEYTSELNSLNQLTHNYHKELTLEISRNIHDIIFVALSKILGSVLAKREVPITIVQNIIEKIGHQKNIIIKVAPKELLLIERYKSRIPSMAQYKILADDSVKLGGCIVELDHAVYDGRLEAQLESIHQSLNNVRSINRENNVR
ncbi:MAG: hypothetical protein HRU38_13880 [Saccharospirillaceae bacterium]|nr:hypothetical protein [Pseudomonadales bacterium]NRB79735.1 hypothetical protein [Saccharospirillaceae bacterium]